MHTHNERGIALILALLLTSAMSALAVSLMFLSQTETYASMNYRMMSQARYAGEAAIQRAGNFLLDEGQYMAPGLTALDPLAPYDRSGSPVLWNGQPVVLSADPAASNYPIPSVKTAFANVFLNNTLAIGNGHLTYTASAQLMSMEKFDAYGGNDAVVQTWKITGVGGLAGTRNGTIQVEAMVETPRIPANSYAAFATADTCGALYFHGNVTVDSYDSGTMGGAASPTMSTFGGNVGTNGNLQIDGSVDVAGNLSTPRTGVGSCSAGAVTALTESGHATVTGSTIQLPKPVLFDKPMFSPVPPTSAVTIDAASLADPALAATKCAALGLLYGAPSTDATTGRPTTTAMVTDGGGNTVMANCTVSGSALIVVGHGSPVTMPSVTVPSGVELRIVGSSSPNQVVNLNSITGAGDINVEANMTATTSGESVVLRVSGKNPPGVTSTLPDPTDMLVPFDLETMGWKQNSAVGANRYDASTLQIAYGGTGTINMDGGNSQSAATIYAPYANFILKGTQDLYGSVLAKTITNGGNANIHYDRRLMRDYYVKGRPMLSTFSWQRY